METSILCLVFAFLTGVVSIRLDAGAYEDLIFQIGTDIPAERCKEILTNLEVSCIG